MRHYLLLTAFLLLVCVPHLGAAPFASQPTARALIPRADVDIDIQVGNLSPVVLTETQTLRKTATVTVMQEDGQPTVSLSVEIVPTIVVVCSTATAKVTEIVHETVVEGKTVPVTITTTGYDVQFETERIQVTQTQTFFEPTVVVVTAGGETITSTTSVLRTAEVAKPQPTAVKDEGEKDKSETEEDEDENPENEDEAISKATVPSESGTESAAVEKPTSKQVKSVQPSATVTITSLSTGFNEQGLPSTATLTATQVVANNNASASADSDATADSNNENNNSVTVNWVEEGNNKTILIVVVCVVVVALIIVIVAIIMSHHGSSSKSGGGATVVYGPGNGGSGASNQPPMTVSSASLMHNGSNRARRSDRVPKVPITVAASMAHRPRRNERRGYGRLGGDEHSEGEMSSSDSEFVDPPSRRRSARSSRNSRP